MPVITGCDFPYLLLDNQKVRLHRIKLPHSSSLYQIDSQYYHCEHFLKNIINSSPHIQFINAQTIRIIYNGIDINLQLYRRGLCLLQENAILSDEQKFLIENKEIVELQFLNLLRKETILDQLPCLINTNLNIEVIGYKDNFLICHSQQKKMYFYFAFIAINLSQKFIIQIYKMFNEQKNIIVNVKRIQLDGLTQCLVFKGNSKDYVNENILLQQGFGQIIQKELEMEQQRIEEIFQKERKAKQNCKGIWFEFQNRNCFVKETFLALVLEIISTNKFLIFNKVQKIKQQVKFAHIETPNYLECYQFQCFNFIRKEIIGKQIYFSKINEFSAISKGFIIRAHDGIDLQKLLIQKGLATLVTQQRQLQNNPYIKSLIILQEKAISMKVGIHSKMAGVTRLINMAQIDSYKMLINKSKKKKSFNGYICNIIQINLMNVVIQNQKLMFKIRLLGIETINSKIDLADIKQHIENGKNYLLENYMQRESVISVDFFNEQEKIFYGKIKINNEDIGGDLIKKGFCFYRFSNQYYNEKYIELENEAKKQSIGLWGKEIKYLVEKSNPESYQKGINVFICQIYNSSTLFFQRIQQIYQIQQIFSQLQQYNQGPKLQLTNYQIGNLAASIFEDNKLYRVQIKSNPQQIEKFPQKYLVKFIDYGNECQLFPNQLFQLPKQLKTIKGMAYKFKFIFVQIPNQTHQLYQQVCNYMRVKLFQNRYILHLVYLQNKTNIFVGYLNLQGISSPLLSINIQLIKEGYGRLARKQAHLMRKQIYDQFIKAEKEAQKQGNGIWSCDDKLQVEYDNEFQIQKGHQYQFIY